MAMWHNDGTAGLALWCSCARELAYDDDGISEIPLDELTADAAEHLRSHGQAVT